MLTRVHIKRFRSCRDVVIDDIGGLIALVGRNGAGKTNILQAIEWAAKFANSAAPFVGFGEIEPSIVFDVAIGKTTTYRYSVDLTLKLAGRNDGTRFVLKESLKEKTGGGKWAPVIRRNRGEVKIDGRVQPIRISTTSASLASVNSLLPATDAIVRRIRPLLKFLAAIRYYPLDEPSRAEEKEPIPDRDYKTWLAAQQAGGDAGESVLMRILHMWLQERTQFDELKSLLGQDGLGLIDDITVLSTSDAEDLTGDSLNGDRFHSIDFCPSDNALSDEKAGGSETHFSYAQLSLGTRRVLRILTSLLFDRSTVMLIEHPEDCVHGGLLRKLIHLLGAYADPGQCILASHSSAVLDSLCASDVRLVTMNEGVTELRALNRREVRAAASFIDQEGSLSDFIESMEED